MLDEALDFSAPAIIGAGVGRGRGGPSGPPLWPRPRLTGAAPSGRRHSTEVV